MTFSPVEIALEEFEKIDQYIRKIYGENSEKIKKCSSAFRSRARSTPSQIIDLGLPSVILFLYSKCGEDVFDALKEEKANGEALNKPLEAAYGLYLLVIKDILRDQLKLISNENPLKFSKELLSDKMKLSLATKSLLKVLIELKKIAEAVYEEEISER